VLPDFGPTPSDPENQVRPRMHRRERRNPDVLEQAEDRELALLVDEGVIGENREVENQGQDTRMDVTRSPLRIAPTTSIPWVT
jgi:hypothetical protein